MLTFLFRLLATLPLGVVHAIGGALGRLVPVLSRSYRRILRDNLAQAGYADRRLLREAAAEAGRQALETPWVWLRPLDDVIARTEVANVEVLERLLADERPVLLLTPHLGCFEVIPKYYGRRAEAVRKPMTAVYRIPRKAILRGVMEAGRAAPNVRMAPAELRGVRMLMRAMQAGETVGILPDQVPSKGEGVWVPFFGRWAYTMTLPARLAVQYEARVCFVVGERLPAGRGWRLHFDLLGEPLSGDSEADAALLNRRLEAVIRRRPAQYLWGYNRYKSPAGAPLAPAGKPA